jgi:hypothetical protein
LAKLAWDFSPEQLDHLFECFQVWLSFCLSVSRYDFPLADWEMKMDL